ncbi:MAG: DUF1446 domain-containing protein [Parachlamydia sp.]|nr:DUF1446 domain-containing protein [Parachlamydia sp.]
MLKIGNAQGFWGDSPLAPARLVKQQHDLDYLTLDYLAEVSLSIMAIQREKDPKAGYARDFVEVVRSLVPLWKEGSKCKVVANAGGLNPVGCAEACKKVLEEAGCPDIRIGVVAGDDVLPLLRQDPDNSLYANLETGEPLSSIADRLVAANAYLGAQAIAEALKQGAQIVITGRVADPSLTVGPCLAHYGWALTDYDRIAGATVAGHLIECGTQVTGGLTTHWLEIEDPAHIGFPVVEIDEDGRCVVTKPWETSGQVDVAAVKEQLLYEIGDPGRYLSPDATVSFLSLVLEDAGPNRVRVSGAKGSAPPETLKVSVAYRDGFKVEGMLAIIGPEAAKKARRLGEIVLQRVQDAGYELERSHIECLGNGDLVPGVLHQPPNLPECILRIAAADRRKEALECLARELAPLVTSGPQGTTGYISGRPKIRPLFGYWPCLVSRNKIS